MLSDTIHEQNAITYMHVIASHYQRARYFQELIGDNVSELEILLKIVKATMYNVAIGEKGNSLMLLIPSLKEVVR